MKRIPHIYIHVPFCSGKCLYCAFHSKIYNSDFAEIYLSKLENEIKTATSRYNIKPKTIYIGGGTPSLLTADQLKRLCQILHRHINLDEISEWTLEGNPGTFTDDKIAIIKEHGITRISLGVQSMNDEILANMARRHTSEQAIQTVQKLQSSGIINIGLDLIAGLPGVAPTTWQQTLDEIINLNPQHISVYALSIDPGSKLHEMQNNNKLEPGCPHPEQRASASSSQSQKVGRSSPSKPQRASASATSPTPDPLTIAENKLLAAGYHHYEISNYAKLGYQCQHNTAIWQGTDYIGFGPAAASRVGLLRWENPRTVDGGRRPEVGDRRSNNKDQRPETRDKEPSFTLHPPLSTLSPETDAVERFMFTFRLYDGINPTIFANNHGSAAIKLLPYWLKQLALLEQEGMVTNKRGTWSLTIKGRNYADTVSEYMLP